MNGPQEEAPPIAAEVARRIRLVVFDVDGVMTDGGVYLGLDGGGSPLELKRFDIQDGLGVKLLMRAGLVVAFVSGRVSEATRLRASELGVEECLQDDGARKLAMFHQLFQRHGVDWHEVSMLADDLPDLPVFERVALPVAVANAQPEIKERSAWSTDSPGGRGAVREFCRELLKARGQWDEVVGAYVDERSRD